MATHRSKEEWAIILSDYETHTGTQFEFCEELGISVSTLQYHIRKGWKNTSPRLVELTSARPGDTSPHTDSVRMAELNCCHPTIGQLMIRCAVTDLAQVVDQINS